MTEDERVPVPESPATDRPVPARRERGPRRGGSLAVALLLALLALGVAGFVAWQQWQRGREEAARAQAVSALDERMARLESTLGSLGDERTLLRQRLGDAEQVNRALREELLGQSERLRDLEDAVAKLSEKSLSGHDATLLDETEALLRLGQQRYTLFHDAAGAAAAYAQAERSLAAVDDNAFAGLRQSIAAEREALDKASAPALPGMLDQLQRLRGALAGLPLKPADRSDETPATGAWARIVHALATVVSVQRDSGAPLAVADGRLTRELAALDLAQAQADLLDHDSAGARAAIVRASAGLTAQFDPADEGVRQARAQLDAMADSLVATPPVQLGGALTELRNLRAVHALGAAGPAPAQSAGSRP